MVSAPGKTVHLPADFDQNRNVSVLQSGMSVFSTLVGANASQNSGFAAGLAGSEMIKLFEPTVES